MAKKQTGEARRFGVGEWYGRSFVRLTASERQAYAQLQALQGKQERPLCPFQSSSGAQVQCNKAGGVCSIRLYQRSEPAGSATLPEGDEGNLRTVCPNRFLQENLIYRWIGEVILGVPTPRVVGQVGFLEREGSNDDVGRIDNILVAPEVRPVHWCALEIQAVYFSGTSMAGEWAAIRAHSGEGVPFPVGNRRPDYRSSGPKRLMPQLQIKVPSLRRWGKKMAVVIDSSFWLALGRMDEVSHVSNCDIAWFVVRYDESRGDARLVPGQAHFTTLERAVEGLTAGSPVSLEEFEQRIQKKLADLAGS